MKNALLLATAILASLHVHVSPAQVIDSFRGTQFTDKRGIVYSINSNKLDDGTYPALLVSIPSTLKGEVSFPETFEFELKKSSEGGIPPGGVSFVQAPRRDVWFPGDYNSSDWSGYDETETHKAKVIIVSNGVFANRSDITGIKLPSSVLNIWSDAFQNCSALKSLELPEQLTYIMGSFEGCNSLEKITLNGKMEKLDTWFFHNVKSLKTIEINCPLKEIPVGFLYGDSSLESVKMPDTVESIGASAFYGCSSLSSVQLPPMLKDIGNYAFHNCESLTEISFPTSLSSIGTYAFYNSGVKDVYAKWVDSPPSLEYAAFSDLYFSATLHIPSSAPGITASHILNEYLTTSPWGYFQKIDDGINKYDITMSYIDVTVGKGGSVLCNVMGAKPVRESQVTFTVPMAMPMDIRFIITPDRGYKVKKVMSYRSSEGWADMTDELQDGVLTLKNLFSSAVVEVEFGETELSLITGDVNNDYVVDVADISGIISLMTEGVSGSIAAYADVNGDGSIDVADIASIISIMAGDDEKKDKDTIPVGPVTDKKLVLDCHLQEHRNSNVAAGTFHVWIPITIEYYWGTFYDYFTITVKSTPGL